MQNIEAQGKNYSSAFGHHPGDHKGKMGMSGYVVSKFYYFGNTYPIAASPCSP
jgi:hypothetical protein